MTPPSSALTILGLGNPMAGDDGVGHCIIGELKRHPEASGIRVEAIAAPGPELVDLLRAEESLWFVDAVRDEKQVPGAIVHYDLDATDAATLALAQHLVSTHGFSLAELLRLSEVLGGRSAHVELWGIVGERFEAGEGLSPKVEQAAKILVNRLVGAMKERAVILETTSVNASKRT